ncbi:PAS domain S-box-containing protein/diguanylate cyclase (GGDEF) domain-containing protein [Neptunomonas antarctica]|uniref:PAS domain S-box-containing protein/diguanylate cyclase (GGDEF) domain-containing protein n=1 Tax=Neptunomonas antarctica TaxID=619304 RepID=A0A1N7JV79_9GAMM|nr:PAS domain S-box-containing protein/diguanylate cyclase (GGDEF) domain-containing protein [Neptunomonas antarctica]
MRILDQNRVESILKNSENHFRKLCDVTPQQLWTADPDGALTYVNKRVTDYFAISSEEALDTGWQKLIHPDDLQVVLQRWTHSIQTGEPYKLDFRLKGADGVYRWHIGQALAEFDGNGEVTEWFGSNTDITDRKEIEQASLTISQLLDQSQQIAKVGGWELNVVTGDLFWTDETYRLHDTSPEKFNPSVEAGVSYFLPESRELISQALDSAINECKNYDLELETFTTQGRKIDIRTTCTVTQEGGKAIRLTGIFQDITDQKNIQRELEHTNHELQQTNSALKHIAHYDSLTHLPNRSLLADRMQQAMKHSKRNGMAMAVAFLDLDGFKEINDNYGHTVGDNLLIHIASKMKKRLREEDSLARIGGDEFVVVLTDLAQPVDCEPLLNRMLEAASEPMIFDGNTVQVSASIGVTIYPQDSVDADQLMRHADQAMYVAKQVGKNRYHFFDTEQDEAVSIQRESLDNIRSALERREFVLYYQPKVNMNAGEVIGVEALIRWQHPVRGLVPPLEFLPAIEGHAISLEIGEWVVDTALTQISQWRNMGIDLPVSVNISAYQLQQDNFSARLAELLVAHPDVEPRFLELEILETSALDDVQHISTIMSACMDLGVSFALDDFGTGYSSLTYLRRLPANLIKIDQSFVRDMLTDPDDLAIIEGVIALTKSFKRNVIAEGVETIEHGAALLELGCELAQGYGIAKPMPASDVPAWLNGWEADISWQA